MKLVLEEVRAIKEVKRSDEEKSTWYTQFQ